MMARTDIHRETVFIPEDYEEFGYYRLAGGEAGWPISSYERETRLRLRQLIASSTTTAYHSGTQCDHCGAHIDYVVVMKHIPTGDYLAIGEVCAQGRFNYSTAEFKKMRKMTANERAQHKRAKAWQAFRDANPAPWDVLEASTNTFVQDVMHKGRTYGEISDKQLSAIIKAVARDDAFAQRRAEWDQEKADLIAQGVKVPSGKRVVEGTIMSMRWQDGAYGSVHKMLVETNVGWKLWVTVPSGIADAEVGDQVQFTCTVTPSDNDPLFGFGSRPSKAAIVCGKEVQ